ncbi:MAG TPA: hypothetical protein VMV02_05810 [Acidimicrobiales bacterium]|nr:hypothetical protein [Acidimicrobiales bacterium]
MATVEIWRAARRCGATGRRARPALVLARRGFADARVRTLGFAYVFALYSFLQPYGYRTAYPDAIGRAAFATSFGANKGLRIFYGEPYDLSSVGGYTAWRVGGTLAIAAAVFGVLAAVRALRAEEDAGRMEIVLAAPLSRRATYLGAVTSIAWQSLVLFVAELVGLLAGGLPAAGSVLLALATVSVVPVFAGLAAVAGEILPTRRLALEYGGAAVAVFLVLRVVADTIDAAGWLRWTSPLGWAEELRPFTGSRPAVLLLAVAATGALSLVPVAIGRTRDLGTGLVAAHDDADGNRRLLSSPLAYALRTERGAIAVWSGGVAAFGFVLGVVSESVSSAGIPKNVERELARLGSGSILTPVGYISFVFYFFVLVVSLFTCAQIVATRRVEADQQLETVLAEPIGRVRWLGGRVAVAAGGSIAVAVASGVSTWLGAAAVGVRMPFGRLVEAGANCLPTALLFLGASVLAYGVLPRASAAISYGVVTVTFLWQAVGSLLGVPRWAVDLTPFAWIGLVPAEAFKATAAATMVALGAGAAVVGIAAFRRRDVLGA